MSHMPGLYNKIKFSHEYEKFNGVEIKHDVLFLQIFKIHKKQLGNDFILYDTTYHENGLKKHYPLPNNDLLVLLFKDINDNLFTTIRRWTPSKEEYYTSLIGDTFKIELIN